MTEVGAEQTQSVEVEQPQSAGCGDSQEIPYVQLQVHGGGMHTGVAPEGFEGIDSHVLDAAPRARLTDEERLEREMTRRRVQDMERRARIFDAKRRTIGVDKEYLDQQCRDNLARRQKEAELAKAEDRQFSGVNRLLQMREKEKNALQMQKEKAMKDYSIEHLHFASRREYDLNDPKAVQKSLPARVGDLDPRTGPASMQKFNGEDLYKDERVRQQKLATVHTLEQQIFEKQAMQRLSDDGSGTFAKQAQEIVELRNEVDAQAAAKRKDTMGKHQAGILAHMAETNDRRQADVMLNQKLNQQELDHHASDPFLQESKPHIHPNGRVCPGLYKGSTQQEREENFKQLMAQQAEKEQRMANTGGDDIEHNRVAEMTRRQLVMMERERGRINRARAAEVAKFNQAMLQKQKDTAADKDYYKNKVSPEYFSQFGVSTR